MYTKGAAMNYEWDPAKAASNLKKHGVRFVDAVIVFEDECAISVEDFEAENEERFCIIGMDAVLAILVVVYVYRFENIIRIISARKATRKEQVIYESGI
jgi:uncharacterized DUF497 family protein